MLVLLSWFSFRSGVSGTSARATRCARRASSAPAAPGAATTTDATTTASNTPVSAVTAAPAANSHARDSANFRKTWNVSGRGHCDSALRSICCRHDSASDAAGHDHRGADHPRTADLRREGLHQVHHRLQQECRSDAATPTQKLPRFLPVSVCREFSRKGTGKSTNSVLVMKCQWKVLLSF